MQHKRVCNYHAYQYMQQTMTAQTSLAVFFLIGPPIANLYSTGRNRKIELCQWKAHGRETSLTYVGHLCYWSCMKQTKTTTTSAWAIGHKCLLAQLRRQPQMLTTQLNSNGTSRQRNQHSISHCHHLLPFTAHGFTCSPYGPQRTKRYKPYLV